MGQSLISITGKDAIHFLQGQLTCDVEALQENLAVLAGHCNRKGRLMSMGWVFRLGIVPEHAIGYVVPSSIAESALARLQKFAVFSKVDISLSSFNVHLSKDNIEAAQTIVLPGEPQRILILSEQVPSQTEAHAWWTQSIMSGQAFLTPETIGHFMPQELNLAQWGGVSLSKGCFIGQEIIARLHYRGKLKKEMVVFNYEGACPVALSEYVDAENGPGQVICTVPSAEHSEHGCGLMLVKIP